MAVCDFGLVPREFGLGGRVLLTGGPKRARFVESGESGRIEVGPKFDDEAEVGGPWDEHVAGDPEERGNGGGGDKEVNRGLGALCDASVAVGGDRFRRDVGIVEDAGGGSGGVVPVGSDDEVDVGVGGGVLEREGMGDAEGVAFPSVSSPHEDPTASDGGPEKGGITVGADVGALGR